VFYFTTVLALSPCDTRRERLARQVVERWIEAAVGERRFGLRASEEEVIQEVDSISAFQGSIVIGVGCVKAAREFASGEKVAHHEHCIADVLFSVIPGQIAARVESFVGQRDMRIQGAEPFRDKDASCKMPSLEVAVWQDTGDGYSFIKAIKQIERAPT
jgi:hypothetical protein